MALNFPNSPSPNDTHVENGLTWKWDGESWIVFNGLIASGVYVADPSGYFVSSNVEDALIELNQFIVASGGDNLLASNNTWTGTNTFEPEGTADNGIIVYQQSEYTRLKWVGMSGEFYGAGNKIYLSHGMRINVGAYDSDFIVDGQTANLLFCDAGQGYVGINTNIPFDMLAVYNGGITASGSSPININAKVSSSSAYAGCRAYNDTGQYLALYSWGTAYGSTLLGITRNNAQTLLSSGASNFMVLTFTSAPMIFGTNNTEAMRVDTSQRLLIGTTSGTLAKVTIDQASTTGNIAVLCLDQGDMDKPFLHLVGTSDATGFQYSLSTYDGAGSVVGPRGQSAGEAAWSWTGMIRTNINGTDFWIPYYASVAGE